MCSGLAAGAVALQALGSAVSAYDQQKATNSQLTYNANVAYRNAERVKIETEYNRLQAEKNITQVAKQTSQMVGAQRASMGSSGLVVDTGTFLDVQANTFASGAEEQAAIMQDRDFMTYSNMQEYENYINDAKFSLASRQSPLYAAGTALFNSGAGSFSTFALARAAS